MPDKNSGANLGHRPQQPGAYDTRSLSKDELNRLIARGKPKPAASSARDAISRVYRALEEKGYDPVRQLTGYILTGEPTYITAHLDARKIIGRVEREELLEELIGFYLYEDEE